MKKEGKQYRTESCFAGTGSRDRVSVFMDAGSSFKKNSEIVALHQTFLPKLFTAGNYVSMNAHFNFMRFFANSIFITLAITVIVIYTSTLCGFVLSKYKFKGRDALFGLVLATMMIPWCVPSFKILHD